MIPGQFSIKPSCTLHLLNSVTSQFHRVSEWTGSSGATSFVLSTFVFVWNTFDNWEVSVAVVDFSVPVEMWQTSCLLNTGKVKVTLWGSCQASYHLGICLHFNNCIWHSNSESDKNELQIVNNLIGKDTPATFSISIQSCHSWKCIYDLVKN